MGSLSGCNPDAIDTNSRADSIASIRVQLPGTPRISSASILPLSSPGSSMMSPPTPGQLFSLTVHSPAFTANMNFNKMTGVRFRTNIGPNGNGPLSAWDAAAQLPVGLRTRVPPLTVVATRGFSQWCDLFVYSRFVLQYMFLV